MNKQDHINFWLRSGNENWDAATLLMQGGKNVEALFMFCLAVEKYIKDNWFNDNIKNIPPRIHDLQSIYSQTDLDLEPDLIDFLDTINRWNIEGRYPDFKFSLYRLATEEYTSKQFQKLISLKSCLLEGF
ncbi:MAG: HEPN domain-containing protein [Saprospiraceae bacterium]|nr:HEPN domain-containing protein [Saprospiraceae bacterium]